jgi:signal recognition particle subunit SRP54
MPAGLPGGFGGGFPGAGFPGGGFPGGMPSLPPGTQLPDLSKLNLPER